MHFHEQHLQNIFDKNISFFTTFPFPKIYYDFALENLQRVMSGMVKDFEPEGWGCD